jgi:PAS domain S-box-containing protein
MGTQTTRPQSTLSTIGQFFENNFIKKFQEISTTAPATSFKKYYQKINRYFFGREFIFLDVDGSVLSWNESYKRLQGYSEKEILGQNMSIFYMPLDRQQQLPTQLIRQAEITGHASQKGKWVRKDGSTFFGRMVIKAIRSFRSNELIGFTEELYPSLEEGD